eukprot:TRINITY_DN2485_c0_g1_i6.p1 TRINITY_DN2485_c0_g1~~TRINITY_DN2485_c0_g1_i6.p1  ORF type:complete len:167 (-),score=33.72 TRINITY_DN2485_c0_g1_i6:1313-1813(-)
MFQCRQCVDQAAAAGNPLVQWVLDCVGGADSRSAPLAEQTAWVELWKSLLHRRVREMYSEEQIDGILYGLASNLEAASAANLCEQSNNMCVNWVGVTASGQAKTIAAKPDGSGDHSIYVNRLVVLFFADDDVLMQSSSLPKLPFKMSCGNQLCVKLAHITAEVDEN